MKGGPPRGTLKCCKPMGMGVGIVVGGREGQPLGGRSSSFEKEFDLQRTGWGTWLQWSRLGE